VDPLQVAGFINAFLFASIILLTYLLATMLFANDRKSTVLATLLTLLSVPLQEVSLMAWSEPLFILLALIFLISLQVFLRDGATTKLLLMTATAAVACLTRYVGVSLIMTGVIGILLLWERPPLKKLGLAFLFGLAASLPLAVWLARNWNVSGTLLGPRSPAASTLMQNLEQSAGLLLTWLAPWLVAMIILVTAGIVVGLRRKEYTQGLGISIRHSGTLNLFTFTYLILLEYSATRTELNAVDNRYMSPLYVPLLLTALSLFTGAADLLRHRLSREGNNLIVFATSAILSWRSRFF
jgi:4-amino-4-deoxy-L-arabinose transferase-like glycosyltransferase